MELKNYLSIMLKKWWVVVPIFLITLTTAIFMTYTRVPIYSTTASFVGAPISSLGDAKDITSGLSILSNREQILITYTEVASSRRLKELAAELIGLDSTAGYSVSSELIRGSNVMRIMVQGPDPVVTRDLANAVGEATIEYVEDLYSVYILRPLDEAKLPKAPISPNIVRDISLAAVLGLVLGVSMAFFISYLESASDSMININIIDHNTGVLTKEYYLQRLNEEMVRAKRNGYPLSVALMRIENLQLIRGFNAAQVRSEALRHVGFLTRQHLRDEDLVSYFGNHVFAFLLLDTSGQQAQSLMEYLQSRVAWAPFQSELANVKLNLSGVVGLAAYNHNGTGRDQLIDMAAEALQLAEVNESGKMYMKSEDTAEVNRSAAF